MTRDLRIVDEPEAAPAWEATDGSRVEKIVLGNLDGDPQVCADLPEAFAQDFARVTHLHLWSLADLERLPPLPAGLKCLDVRKCPDLRELPALPGSLEELIVEDCPALTTLPLPARLETLWDLSCKGCAGLTQQTMHAALVVAPGLRRLDLSGCENLREVPFTSWPSADLERIDLNDCDRLGALPARWPPRLRRLGLRGASALTQLPPFHEWPDYLDLAGTRSLEKIPRPGPLRTLFLHGSGLLVPPATEHGRHAQDNVAARTLAYYNDVELCGKGEVKRCKLLVLGNGDAGKTCLSLALAGEDPDKAKDLGSTHGVQFWSWDNRALIGAQYDAVDLQLWDFGGQEIYHQTHQLFMSKGAVFVVVWHPDQDGRQPAENANGYQDEWRPLQYWLDFVHLACPWKPRIAIVCSHRGERTDELDQQLRDQVSPEYLETCACFYVDSLEGTGDQEDLKKWICESVGDVVGTQGTAVPAYWEIAQDLVRDWLSKASYEELDRRSFARLLEEEIARVLEAEPAKFARMRAARANGSFKLTEDRVRRTLEFLTNSGWVYWDEYLFEERVIVGQKWALEGIYTVLDRRPKSAIYRDLRRVDGQFTRRALAEWVWNAAGYTEPQQQLLISFMRQVGVCFQLIGEGESRWREAVYKTFQHLPLAKELDLQRRFDRSPGGEVESVESTLFHRGHWNALLKDLGERYGTDGEYAWDGFELVNQEGQHVLLVAFFESGGLGGRIDVSVRGPDAHERLKALVPYVRGFLPGDEPASSEGVQPAGTKADRVRVFVSYKRNSDLTDPSIDYEEAVDRIEKALPVGVLLRDRNEVKAGDSVMGYIDLVRDVDIVLVVHSDEYWRSDFCMFELSRVRGSLTERPKTVRDTLLFLEMESSRIFGRDRVARDSYLKHWKEVKGISPALEGMTDVEKLRAAAIDLLENFVPEIHDSGKKMPWAPGEEHAVIAWIERELGLSEADSR